jgi:hypothetical protein
LRVLEYYNGILFLTTNRTGALDEAFKSRIHLQLYYPPLTATQTREIWQMNLRRLKLIEEQRCEGTGEQVLEIYEDQIMDFALNQYHNPKGKGKWNGRQIRNAVQVASSLACYDARKHRKQLMEQNPDTPVLRPKLDVEHFKMIHDITASFDQYIEETIGKSDAEQAHEAGERADHFVHPRSFFDEGGHAGHGVMSHSNGERSVAGASWVPGGTGGWSNNRWIPQGRSSSHFVSNEDGYGFDQVRTGRYSFAHPSPSPSQRPSMKGMGSSSFGVGGHMSPHDREFGSFGGPNGQHQGGFPSNRNPDHISPEYLGTSQGPGSFGHSRDGHGQPEFGPPTQGSVYDYENEYGRRSGPPPGVGDDR